MIKVLLVAESKQLQDLQFLQLCNKLSAEIVAKAAPGTAALKAIRKYKPDLVISSVNVAIVAQNEFNNKTLAPRTSVMASTHQGIQLVPIADIKFFQAEHKYVTAHHNKGELLIEDSLASLEIEFAQLFVRIHRKTLIAISQIENLFRDETGQHFLKLYGLERQFPVSRRQLPVVRKVLLCK